MGDLVRVDLEERRYATVVDILEEGIVHVKLYGEERYGYVSPVHLTAIEAGFRGIQCDESEAPPVVNASDVDLRVGDSDT